MSTEQEKRLQRCCFTGQRPEKLTEAPEAVQQWLKEQIENAIDSYANVESNYCYLDTGNHLSFFCIDGLNIHIDRILYGCRDYLSILIWGHVRG